VYKTDATTTALGNVFTAKCSSNFTGIAGVDAVAFNVAGGSFTAVTVSAGNATAAFANTTGGTAQTGTANLGVIGAAPALSLRTAPGETAGLKSIGGFLDIEPLSFPESELIAAGVTAASLPAKTTAASFSQVFGVAVSNDLYKALQTAQTITTVGDDRLPVNQPTISRAAYASIVSDAFNSAKQDINALFGVGVAGDKLTLCRRVSTSGTQSVSNEYFLKTFTGFDGANGGGLGVADAATYGAGSGLPSYEVNEGSGTSNARTCLNANGFAVGFLSLENNPAAAILTGELGGYRFVKLSNVAAYDGASNTASAFDGSYDLWFQSFKFANNATATTVLDAIDAQLATGLSGVTGLFPNSANTYKRNGSNAQPITKE
jgi:hypothetical protein